MEKKFYVVWDVFVETSEMFNIFEYKNKTITEEWNFRFMLKKVQRQCISNTVKTLKTRVTTETGGRITLTSAVNNIVKNIPKFPDYIAENFTVSGLKSSK